MRSALHGILCCGVLLMSTSASSAQEWAEKMFDKNRIEFGSVAKGADVRTRITVTNKYKEPIELLSAVPKCACISANMKPTTLASLQSAEIEVVLNTVGFSDERNTSVTVHLGGQFATQVVIPVHAFIRRDVVLTPGSVDFGPVGRGSALDRKVQIAYAGRNNWTIKDIQNTSKHLDAKVVETGRSGGRVNYDLIVRLKPDAPMGDLRTQLTLVTDDPNTPRIPVLVEGKVEAEYTVQPDLVQFGVMNPGEKKTINIVVRANNRKPFAIEKLESEKTADAFEVRLSSDSRTVHILPLTLTAPSEAGVINEEFTLKVAGMEDPIRFKVFGKVLSTTGAARLIGR